MSSVIFSLLDTPAFGGAETYLLEALFHLKRRGYRVVLATNNTQVKETCEGKIEVISLPYRLDAIGNWKGLLKYFYCLPYSLAWFVMTVQRLKRENFKFQISNSKTINDKQTTTNKVICIFPGFTDRLSFSPFVKLLGCKLIWLEYGPLEPTFRRNFGFPKLLYAVGRPFVDQVVTISEWTKKSLVRLGKIPEEKIQIIYPGISEKKKLKNEKGTTYLIATVARLAQEKEIDLLLHAWKALPQLHAEGKLLIIGDGPERSDLEKVVKTLDLVHSVTFTGFVSEEEKRRLLLHSHLFVFPSAWELEGFGMTTVEAMSLERPVISSGFGPQAEIIKDGVTGRTFIPHSAESLAKVIEEFLQDPNLQKIAESGKVFASKVFSRDRFLDQWDRLIRHYA